MCSFGCRTTRSIDGLSHEIFQRELVASYEALIVGAEPNLPALDIQYADYAAWATLPDQVEAQAAHLKFWKKQLAGELPVLELPLQGGDPRANLSRGHVEVRLPSPMVDALVELGRKEGATLFMTLLAAYQTLLLRFSRQEEIVVGTPSGNREQPQQKV